LHRAADYRPQIDGVRAVAVTTVVLFHLGFAWMPGGFIGVDVFFVLSGYLITGLLLAEATTRHTISLGRFYARRARRLLPAAWLVIAFSVIAGKILSSPIEYENLRRHAVSAVLYVANWDWVTVDRGYFATDTRQSPLIHFWSLAVEEQFYLVWPALIVASLWVARRLRVSLRTVLTVAFTAITVASIALAVFLTPSTASYYGTHTRAFELTAGGLLALVMERRRRRIASLGPRRMREQPRPERLAAALTLTGLGGVTYLCLTVAGSTSYPGWSAVTVTAVSVLLIAGVDLHDHTWVARVLGNVGFAWVGRLSYSLYLWHWPMIVFYKDRLPLPTLVVLIVTTSAVSYYLWEQPLRRRAFPTAAPWKVVATGLVASAAFGFIVIPAGLQNTETEKQVITAREDFSEPPADCPYDAGQWPVPAESDACTVTEGAGPTVLLVGDSHAQMWAPALEEIAEQRSWNLLSLTRAKCTPTDFTIARLSDNASMGADEPTPGEECTQWREAVYPRVIADHDPDFVIVGSRSQVYSIEQDDDIIAPGDPRYRSLWRGSWSRMVATFGSEGARVLVLEPMPTLPRSMLECLASEADAGCEFDATQDHKTSRADAFVKQLPQRFAYVDVVDVADIACPGGVCAGRLDGDIVYQDPSHVTATFAADHADQLAQKLRYFGLPT